MILISAAHKAGAKKRMNSSTQVFLELLEQVEMSIPIYQLKDLQAFPIHVVLDRATASNRMGQTRGAQVTLHSRAFLSSGTFLYTAFHEIGHVVFSLLKEEAREDFLAAIKLSPDRWKKLVLKGTSEEDPAFKKAALLEIRRIHEEFAESYAEYWTKRSYLEARSVDTFHSMRKLFWSEGKSLLPRPGKLELFEVEDVCPPELASEDPEVLT